MTSKTSANGSLEARIEALRGRHARLDAQIRDEQARPLPNMERLRGLKGRKLVLKDEMAYYSGVLRTLGSYGEEQSA